MTDIISTKTNPTDSDNEFEKYENAVKIALETGLFQDSFVEFLLLTLKDKDLYAFVNNVNADKWPTNLLDGLVYPKGNGYGYDIFVGNLKKILKAAIAFNLLQYELPTQPPVNNSFQLSSTNQDLASPQNFGYKSSVVWPTLSAEEKITNFFLPPSAPVAADASQKTAKVIGLPETLFKKLPQKNKNNLIKYRHERDMYKKYGTSAPSTPNYDFCAEKDSECGLYPRYIMPQIDDIGQFVKNVRSINIPMSYTEKSITPNELHSSQSEVSVEGVKKKIAGLNQPSKPIIISSDNWVIDGHHRFGALKKNNLGDTPIQVIQLSKNRDYVFEAAAAIGVEMAERRGPWTALGEEPKTYNPTMADVLYPPLHK